MRPVDSTRKIKQFKGSLRPSQSLHARFFKSSSKELFGVMENSNPEEINIYIIFKKKKIQFQVKKKTPFKELNRLLYLHLHKHLIE